MRTTRCVLALILVALVIAGAACTREGVTSVGKAPVEGSATVSAVEVTASGDATAIALPEGSAGSAPVAVAIARIVSDGRFRASELKGRVARTSRTRTEEWARVVITVTRPGYDAEQVFVSRKLEGGPWEVRDLGTGLGPEDLVSVYGFSQPEADALFGR